MIRRNSGGSERPCEEGALGSATRGFPCGSAGKESACNAGDLGSVSGLGRSPGGGHGNLFQYSCLENPHGKRSLEKKKFNLTCIFSPNLQTKDIETNKKNVRQL